MLIRAAGILISLGLLVLCGFQYLVINDLNEALNQQGINTSHVEIIMRNENPEIPYKEFKEKLNSSFGEGQVRTYEIDGSKIWLEAVDDALFVNGTVFYFKDGIFYGTKLEKGSSLKEIVLNLLLDKS